MRHLFHLLLVLSLSMSYCVTDGDEPAKAPETKKNPGFLNLLDLVEISKYFEEVGRSGSIRLGSKPAVRVRLANDRRFNPRGHSLREFWAYLDPSPGAGIWNLISRSDWELARVRSDWELPRVRSGS